MEESLGIDDGEVCRGCHHDPPGDGGDENDSYSQGSSHVSLILLLLASLIIPNGSSVCELLESGFTLSFFRIHW